MRIARTATAVAMLGALAFGASTASAAAPRAQSPSLLKNGTAEAAAGGTGGVVAVPKWTRQTGTKFTVVKYGTPGFPSTTDPAPPNRGANFFAGGPNDPNFSDEVAVQNISLSTYANQIGTGNVTFTAAGWFGGKLASGDLALMEIDFKDANGFLTGPSTTVGGVTAANRQNKTGLLHRLKTASVPADAKSVFVQLIFENVDGNRNNGYADNLTLTLSGV